MEVSAQYLAGLFDGEGCIHFMVNKRNGKLKDGKHSTRVNTNVQIANTYLPVLKAIQEIWKGKIYPGASKRIWAERGLNVRQVWNLCWSTQDEVVAVLYAIQPYVIIKKDQVDFFISEYVPTMGAISGSYFLTDEDYKKRFKVREALSSMKKVEFTTLKEE